MAFWLANRPLVAMFMIEFSDIQLSLCFCLIPPGTRSFLPTCRAVFARLHAPRAKVTAFEGQINHFNSMTYYSCAL
jgi:hypothetical protein